GTAGPARCEATGPPLGIVTQVGRQRVARRRPSCQTIKWMLTFAALGRGPPSGGRRPDRRGQAPKGTGGMPRRHQQCGRGRLRNVRGSCPTSVDPGMLTETRGTETSQYPEEEKATAIPLVAASERGPA